jgi:hypothetical protein
MLETLIFLNSSVLIRLNIPTFFSLHVHQRHFIISGINLSFIGPHAVAYIVPAARF